ncbi:MAG: DUF547 domain-containing protein [Pseudomonadota bacterium]|nr:DUF547 domain-containing protein [Pseudomonadota bacterium]
MRQKWLLRAGLGGLPLLIGAAVSLAEDRAPAAVAGDAASLKRWSAHDPASPVRINYDPLDKLLTAYVVPEGNGRTLVPFARLKGDGQRVLEAFVSRLEQVQVETLSRDEQLAYWLNLRTLVLLHQTIDAFPVSRPQETFRGPNAVTANRVLTVSGEPLSVDDIDRIVLANWSEPHVIYGLTLPVLGAPGLPRTAFRGSSVHHMLQEAGRDFINRAGVIRVKGDSAELSNFFTWHRAAFGNEAKLLEHIRSLAAPKLAGRLAGAATISQRFDWKLAAAFERSFDARDPTGTSVYEPSTAGSGS